MLRRISRNHTGGVVGEVKNVKIEAGGQGNEGTKNV
jgi:hypothetical protein